MYKQQLDYTCGLCMREFRTQHSVEQHEQDGKGRCRFEKYYRLQGNPFWNKRLNDFHDGKANLCIGARRKSKGVVQDTLNDILSNADNKGRYETKAMLEGSYKTGLKIGKPDEFDFSVGLLVPSSPRVSGSHSVGFRYTDNDIDHGGVSSIKRSLDERNTETIDGTPPPVGFRVVQMKRRGTKRFSDSVIQGILVPFEVLVSFHHFVLDAVGDMDNTYGITVARSARGPAISLFINHPSIVHQISVDLTPVVYIDNAGPVLNDHGWPRTRTRDWLTEGKINTVFDTEIYLVPKGDKFWKISFARCEDVLLRDIDGPGVDGTRKTCLRICKMKLKQWKSRSDNGLKGISSYMLKTTMLWLCEIFPDDEDWVVDELSARYVCFMFELQHSLRKRYLGEYFIPQINLLDGKDKDDIDELLDFVEDELRSVKDMFDNDVAFNHCLNGYNNFDYLRVRWFKLLYFTSIVKQALTT